ncbi:DUF2384 domain-containing protein [bacterium]|nr:MAG: DUF2384 domain-containing protein [bacterium]
MARTPVAATKPSASVEKPDLAAPALRAFFNIADHWALKAAEQRVLLGNPPSSTFFKWKKERRGPLPRDVLERISYVLGIYKALQILLPDAARADAWVRQPNAAVPFGGRSALDQMLGGNVSDLFVVRQYLDGERG